ncbi:CD248 molecule, endosialin a [Osmerus eperlanus]|uniref:CD248 molecule, endosialin a n=1 Tax=Osmerus eperlanus TaxID=29151 RepID=UPI002E10C8E5
MGSFSGWTAALLLSLLGLACGVAPVSSQDLRERDALCNEDGCFVLYFQRKTFLDSWRSCKDKGGNLATVKRQEEADTIAALFSGVELRGSRTAVRVWIGLQRQPRQCTASRPLRGFSWTTGDQDTQYTNWLKDDTPGACSAPRCVVTSYSTVAAEQRDNFKWLDGSCSVPVDGYLCRYTYAGMCPALWSEGAGNALYTTPFNLLSTLLTHLPFGSVATVPCPSGAKDEQSVLCMLRDDGTVGWSKDAPLCTDDAPVEEDWCRQDNGGCEHFCRVAGTHYYCECFEGFQVSPDGQSCTPNDPCQGAPCEFECLPISDGYRCACPEGYMLAPDESGCLDVDECLQSPCEQLCVNAPGSFECGCREGYRTDEKGECEDVDECARTPCEHACENTPGSHACHCHYGYSPLPGDPSHCQDVDECQIPGMCQQMCVNYEGGFECYCEVGYELLPDHFACREIGEGEEPPTATPADPWATRHPGPVWDPQEPVYYWTPQQSQTDWPPEEGDSLNWLTDPPAVAGDVIWVTSAPKEDPPTEDPPTEEPEDDKQEVGVHLAGETTPGPTSTPPPTPTPYLYEDEEEEDEEITTTSTPLPTSTISEGAWNWLWVSPIPANQDPVWPVLEEPITPGNYPDQEYLEETAYGDNVYEDSSLPARVSEFDEERKGDYDEVTSTPAQDTPFQPPLSSLSPGPIVTEEDEGEAVDVQGGGGQKEGGNWLLVGLLVPVCIFVVVMVALGIVYCTRCAVQPRNKSATDCYHWISGAHDKQGAPNPGAGVKTHV